MYQFMNLSTAPIIQAFHRSGIEKCWRSKKTLVKQFLGESILCHDRIHSCVIIVQLCACIENLSGKSLHFLLSYISGILLALSIIPVYWLVAIRHLFVPLQTVKC